VTATPTTGSKVGIIYSTGKLHVRAHIFVDSDAEWPQIEATLPSGCSIAYVPMSAHLGGHETFYPAIAAALGHASPTQQFTDPRCVVIDSGSLTVEQIIMADDSIDTLPGKTLINHQLADIGNTFDPVLQQFTVPSYTLPAKAGVRATPVVVPAAILPVSAATAS
jgi:hypothetical protein